MKAHRKYLRLINLRLDGRLSEEAGKLLDEHLHDCEACMDEYETLAAIRRNLLTVADVPLDPVTTERRTAGIMAAIRQHASGKRAPRRVGVLRPAIVLASLVVIFVLSLPFLQRTEPPGPILFTDPKDVALDSILVSTLNEHELVGVFEAFSDPAVVKFEMDANNGFKMRQLR